ncbi:MAG TPA: cytochrome c oxidase subunit II [Anaerolineales bacterium]|nr:cytochrome c oxidase subunit II [Anaerolineales bacterium]
MKQLRHFLITAVLIAALTAGIGILLEMVIDRMPLGASLQAGHIESLLVMHFWAIAFLFALIVGFMLYSIFAFRQKKGELEDGDHLEGHTPLELVWTIVPTGVVIWFAFVGGQSLTAMETVDRDALRVNVTARQWSWTFDYPEYGVSSDVLVLPVDSQTLLRLRSTDVVHSFWVPEFGPKQDLLPGGEVRELRIDPTLEGEYTLACAELCGRQHATMLASVQVMSRAEFDAWIEMKVAEDPCAIGDPAGCGQKLAQESGCLACHSVDGTALIGPTWLGVFGSEEVMIDGEVVVVDVDYLIESIREPEVRIVTGFENVMPSTISDHLSDEDVLAIIAFIESLE